MTIDLRTLAEQAATARLRALKPTTRFLDQAPGYLADWADNLVAGVTTHDFEADLRHGAGNELTDRPDERAKFRASYSSSALAVNTFGPFRHHPDRLTLFGRGGFSATRFERACPNGLSGTGPHFDFWCLSADAAVAIESKFLETMDPKTAKFSGQYLKPFVDGSTRIVESPWADVFQALRDDPKTYAHLDAAQLLKHYLGLKHSHPDRERVLLYLFWEPTNAAALPEYVSHRNEVRDFARRVKGCATRFIALSHADLWSHWQDHSHSPDMPEHLTRLRQRYSFSI